MRADFGASGDLESLQRSADRAVTWVQEHHPSVVQIVGRDGCRGLLMTAVTGDDRFAPKRFIGLPDYEGRPIWVLDNDRDVARLRAEIQSGQVWINVGRLDESQFRGLWGAISYQQQVALGQSRGRPGRPQGRRDPKRVELIRLVRESPQSTDREIYEAGLANRLWTDDGPYEENIERNRRRAQRIRAASQETSDE